ncbi:MAG: hypothetical protein M1308_11800 [Actinobacteria bacterium]|nr:hypothetical protein [Actinomycetota bacterium]
MEKIIITEEIKNETSIMVKNAEDFTITSELELNQGSVILSQIRKAENNITAKKEAITKPLNEALKNARALFKPFEEQLKNATDIMKIKIISYQEKLIKEASEKRKNLLDNIDPFDTSDKTLSSLKDTEVSNQLAGGVGFRSQRQVVITDEKLVPKEYFIIDMVRLNKDVLAGKKVPGTEIKVIKNIAIKNAL